RIAVIFLTLVMGVVVACSKRPSDDTIAGNLQNKIAADPITKDSAIEAVVKDGKVTLRGTARTTAAQQKAEEFARLEPGVVGIEDVTAVEGGAATGPAPVSPEPSQPVRARRAAAPAPVEKPRPQPLVVPAGTVLTVRLGAPLSSKSSQSGQSFPATLAQPVSVGERHAIPAGAPATGTVVTAKAKGKIKGSGQLDLALTSITVRGRTYPIQTRVLENTVKGKGKRTAATTGGGAAGGALIGGLAGGGKGAGIGALVGAGAGFVGGTLTGNKQIEIPAEAALSFELSVPLTIGPSAE
ncbi:MAG: BON domain-containing protein, partial [Chlamydiota bacterium]